MDPKNHDLRLEINRIKQANLRLKKLQDSSKAPKLNIPVAKRFIKSALFDPEAGKTVDTTDDIEQDDENGERQIKRLRSDPDEETKDIEMKPDTELKESDETKDETEKIEEEEDEDDGEVEIVGTKINSDNTNKSDRFSGESRKRKNEGPSKGSSKKRMFRKQLRKKFMRKSNRKMK